jgi:hypothetical protein
MLPADDEDNNTMSRREGRDKSACVSRQPRNNIMRKWLAPMCLLALFGAGLLRTAAAQEPSGDVSYSRYRHFLIPFQAGSGASKLKQLQLFVSTDKGKTWHPSATVPPDLPPEKQRFPFICEQDGQYWFTVQTLGKDGKYFPPTLEGAKPSLKVIVDTLPPEVKLQPLQPKNGEVGVSWEIHEDYIDLLDPKSVRLDYRPVGGEVWIPLDIDRAVNQFYWEPLTANLLEVRLQAQDKAGNIGTGYTKVGLKAGGGAPPDGPGSWKGKNPIGPGNFPAAPPNRKLVNSKKISLNYKLEEVGPSGVSQIELWFTQDGRSWNSYPLPKADDNKIPNPLTFEVSGEGVYGFTLLAKSGVGLGVHPPQIGDEPQIWVEVDLTKPQVKLQKLVVGKGADKGKLFIDWSAWDKNLAKNSITLSYAENLGGPWHAIVQKHANTSHYTWKMPEPVPYQFYVRIDASDLAGNIGEDTTQDLIRVDLSQPKVNILEVGPAGGGNP